MTWKWLRVPLTNETEQIRVPLLYAVRWYGRSGNYHSDAYPKIEAFTTQQQADDFATSLKNAFQLLGITGDAATVIVKPSI